ncbi:uncharacterized protein MYCFIDRAFT_210810 [Pseudocercospora fijiensis CIRAD86]|uniref:Protein kinase domain-containing protein n=1 Tax=Pseudocercospora fijiensis (strain CIRAD86) TaxID=383855 RepID=M3AHX6_PSEFD|nr:uncharacterized protein MYCFIDRAFT_210810 [Pseudocercospora fijiensis CIRAD86]EME84196.1 hypothetical protein MYCFIDRAFT_210810 [Pseudocercospora fijiensis CIRAD86]
MLLTCKALRRSSGAYRFNDRIVIKVGDASRMSEAAAMRLLSEKTAIPIPTVHDAYIQDDGCGVIIMEYVEGVTLDKAWPTYDLAQKQAVVHQLKRYLNELRQIQSPVISSVDGEPCCDQFFSWDMREYGPYSTEMQFHEGLVQALHERADHSWSRMVARFLRSMSGHETVLTHNDLTPSNILVNDGSVVAILDWELAGFYPDYWEYVKAYLFADWQSIWVADSIPDKILQPKRTELAFMLHARDIMWP